MSVCLLQRDERSSYELRVFSELYTIITSPPKVTFTAVDSPEILVANANVFKYYARPEIPRIRCTLFGELNKISITLALPEQMHDQLYIPANLPVKKRGTMLSKIRDFV